MFSYSHIPNLVIALLLTIPHFCLAQTWQLDTQKSSIRFTGTHAGEPFQGSFPEFSADLVFDPEHVAQSHAVLRFALDKTTTSDYFYTKTLQGKGWFDTLNHPQAQFVVDTITPEKTGDNLYTVTGTLTIKDIAHPLTFRCTIKSESTRTIAEATFPIDRLDYAIGATQDPDGSWVSKTIMITAHLEATPTNPQNSEG